MTLCRDIEVYRFMCVFNLSVCFWSNHVVLNIPTSRNIIVSRFSNENLNAGFRPTSFNERMNSFVCSNDDLEVFFS